MMLDGALSFNKRELETMLSFRTPKAEMEGDFHLKQGGITRRRSSHDHLSRSFSNLSETNFYSPRADPFAQRDQAALKLQKVYKSFRTRRQLADCAVLAEQRWWKALDFAELKRSSISFFDIEKPETAFSRWSRASKRAAKVGKGLSKDKKARKLALQHWLEAIDPRHRYGHNLQFYYVKWLHCDSNQPFFYWLDIGEGRELSCEICPRSRLLQQCIKYLGPAERKAYEVVIESRRLFYKECGKPVHTTGDIKWIFVLSTSMTLYVGTKSKGTFQHSSFLAGGATLSAGRLVVEDGVLKAVWPHSGHYLPTEENFQIFMQFLKEKNVDLTDVEKCPREAEEEETKINGSEALLPPTNTETESSSTTLGQEPPNMRKEDSNVDSRLSRRRGSKVSRLEIPKRCNVLEMFREKVKSPFFESPDSESGYETAEESFIDEEDFMVSKSNLFDKDENKEGQIPIPKEKLMKRIDSHKGMKSYQLANHLATKWTTGAGPRIGCMRDYPPELQCLILEQQNLSPRTRTTGPPLRIRTTSRFSSPNNVCPLPSSTDSQILDDSTTV